MRRGPSPDRSLDREIGSLGGVPMVWLGTGRQGRRYCLTLRFGARGPRFRITLSRSGARQIADTLGELLLLHRMEDTDARAAALLARHHQAAAIQRSSSGRSGRPRARNSSSASSGEAKRRGKA